MDKRAVDSSVNLLLLLESMSNLLWEVDAEITNGFSLEDLLWLVEFLSHESIKVVIEDKVLKLGELL